MLGVSCLAAAGGGASPLPPLPWGHPLPELLYEAVAEAAAVLPPAPRGALAPRGARLGVGSRWLPR